MRPSADPAFAAPAPVPVLVLSADKQWLLRRVRASSDTVPTTLEYPAGFGDHAEARPAISEPNGIPRCAFDRPSVAP
jgi:hypothetical protein